ncbi:MAG: hypothetical protein A2133_07425 [Actinobacteria bacterium RBG_16_64_13]|nr:MAG: hypothetical protein A2133_07425 [Actinobacteria bacterium RBG_16_64_13]
MAGAQLPVLKSHNAVAGETRTNELVPVAENHRNPLWFDGAGGFEYVEKHGSAADRVQYFG